MGLRVLHRAMIVSLAVSAGLFSGGASAAQAGVPDKFTLLRPIAVSITDSAEAHSAPFVVEHLIDGKDNTQYASSGKGTDTFVVFDVGATVPLAAFRYVDRRDPATVARSELTFMDEDGNTVGQVELKHANTPGGITERVFDKPITARRVRWQVTELGSKYATVGGSAATFFMVDRTTGEPEMAALDINPLRVLRRDADGPVQPVKVSIAYPYAEPLDATLRVTNGNKPLIPARAVDLRFGTQAFDLVLPAVESKATVSFALVSGEKTIVRQEVPIEPAGDFVVYILPHSHVDIGYTEVQTEIEKKQIANIDKGLELARTTADYPEGARYKWNVEVLWAVDSYMRTQPPEKRQALIEAVRNGQIGLDALYCNILTGLCRPEELVRLFSYGECLSRRCGKPIESAMISDVPGYIWGIVTAMGQSGVKYWSIGPNYFARIGHLMDKHEHKPFWWEGPTGRDRVLCWVPWQGYASSHLNRETMHDAYVIKYMDVLRQQGYPYDITYLRWSGFSDNAEPDAGLPEFVKSWNERHASPRLIIATTSEAFRAFEERHGSKLPVLRGDWTPYWEDGAGSSARETGLNRGAAERLVQAETLFALLRPQQYYERATAASLAPPFAEQFRNAWRNVLLYSEHTWGAHNSIREPEHPDVAAQWKIKQGFALDADEQSRKLLRDSVLAVDDPSMDSRPVDAMAVYNTTSWPRSEVVTIPAGYARNRYVRDAGGHRQLFTQRLSSGDLAIFAEDVPPLASRSYMLGAGSYKNDPQPPTNAAKAQGATLDNGIITIRLDETTGNIIELRAAGIDRNFADTSKTQMNEYFYVLGTDVDNPLRSGPVTISVKETGPLVASLLVESDAPGAHKLTREYRLCAEADHVEIVNVVDKKRVDIDNKSGDYGYASMKNKEAVHFGFAFEVPDGVMRMDVPWAVIRPEIDQMPGACKNWFSVQRWVDVSNDDVGVTWATLDAPLVEVGAITADILGTHNRTEDWIEHLEASQTLYSWAMNNHWFTNYRAYQEGPTTFRYAVRPHAGYSAAEATRFGRALSQPLVMAPLMLVLGHGALTESRVTVSADDVFITAFKPVDQGVWCRTGLQPGHSDQEPATAADGQDAVRLNSPKSDPAPGKAIILRLFAATPDGTTATLTWADPQPTAVWLSDLGEQPIRRIEGPIDLPPWGMATLRVEFD